MLHPDLAGADICPYLWKPTPPMCSTVTFSVCSWRHGHHCPAAIIVWSHLHPLSLVIQMALFVVGTGARPCSSLCSHTGPGGLPLWFHSLLKTHSFLIPPPFFMPLLIFFLSPFSPPPFYLSVYSPFILSFILLLPLLTAVTLRLTTLSMLSSESASVTSQ